MSNQQEVQLDEDIVAMPDHIETWPSGEERLTRLERMVKEHAAATFRDGDWPPLLVDVQTANMLAQVARALNEENRAKFLSKELVPAVILGWKLVG